MFTFDSHFHRQHEAIPVVEPVVIQPPAELDHELWEAEYLEEQLATLVVVFAGAVGLHCDLILELLVLHLGEELLGQEGFQTVKMEDLLQDLHVAVHLAQEFSLESVHSPPLLGGADEVVVLLIVVQNLEGHKLELIVPCARGLLNVPHKLDCLGVPDEVLERALGVLALQHPPVHDPGQLSVPDGFNAELGYEVYGAVHSSTVLPAPPQLKAGTDLGLGDDYIASDALLERLLFCSGLSSGPDTFRAVNITPF